MKELITHEMKDKYIFITIPYFIGGLFTKGRAGEYNLQYKVAYFLSRLKDNGLNFSHPIIDGWRYIDHMDVVTSFSPSLYITGLKGTMGEMRSNFEIDRIYYNYYAGEREKKEAQFRLPDEGDPIVYKYRDVLEKIMIINNDFRKYSIDKYKYISDVGWKMRYAFYLMGGILGPVVLNSQSFYKVLTTEENPQIVYKYMNAVSIKLNRNFNVIEPTGNYAICTPDSIRFLLEFDLKENNVLHVEIYSADAILKITGKNNINSGTRFRYANIKKDDPVFTDEERENIKLLGKFDIGTEDVEKFKKILNKC